MNSLIEVFGTITQKLDDHAIPYMVVGSVGCLIYGEPRLTKDLDLIIELPPQEIQKFLTLFDEEHFYVPPLEILIQEGQQQGQFNLIHNESGLKIDFIFRKDHPHSLEEFQRKVRVPFTSSASVSIATPEDIIIKKLTYYDQGRSEKHIQDIRGILAQTPVDQAYLEKWIKRLHLEEFWNLCR